MRKHLQSRKIVARFISNSTRFMLKFRFSELTMASFDAQVHPPENMATTRVALFSQLADSNALKRDEAGQ